MSLGRTAEQYNAFTFEDFLQDDYFIAKWTNPTPEIRLFWDAYSQGEVSDGYKQACQYMDLLHDSQPHLSKVEEEDLWQAIAAAQPVAPTQHIRRLRPQLWYAAAVAAIVLLFVGVRVAQRDALPDTENMSLAQFVQSSQVDSGEKREQVSLVISGTEKTYLEGKNPEIVYKDGHVLTSNDKEAQQVLTPFNQLITPHGKRSMLELEDGTKVWVNSGTTITYPVVFAKDKREIYVDGEVFLDVAHQPERPFIVTTRDLSVQVLGTRFSVSAYADVKAQQVVLQSGKVQVNAGHQVAYLAPNQMFEQANGQARKTQVDATRLTSWIHGYYSFESTPFGEIAEQLSRYYGVKIYCDPEVSTRTFSGKLHLEENLDKLLKGLSFSVAFRHQIQGNEIHISKKPI